MEYHVDDRALEAEEFLGFASRVWPGDYDVEKTRAALTRTLNITARDGGRLTDGYFFGTITELLVLPEYQGRGVGSALLRLAREHAPTLLYFGAQPGVEGFYEKNGCKRSLQAYCIEPQG